MKKLLELTKDFKVSRPVFRLQIHGDGSIIHTSQIGGEFAFTAEPIEGNILSDLVCSSYSETFDARRGSFYHSKDDIAKRAMHHIRNSISQFVECNLEMKNPRQSKLYRWTYRNMPANEDFNDVLIMVYNYLRSFTDSDMRGSNPEHIKNGLAILEAIMEKYER